MELFTTLRLNKNGMTGLKAVLQSQHVNRSHFGLKHIHQRSFPHCVPTLCAVRNLRPVGYHFLRGACDLKGRCEY